MPRSLKILAFLASLLAPVLLAAASPVVIEGLPVSTPPPPPNVTPTVPVGKVLFLPVSAYNAAGEPITITASSSNPSIMVRVKSGNPLLKLTISHAGGTSDPAYSGDVVFQLFRDLTPQTAGFIGGFAQSGFYNGLTFHRIAQLYSSFIIQGGDPNGNGSGGPGFDYDNEFSPQAIFAGAGQLAMANSGYDSTSFQGTNGSQFFITTAPLRQLDFKYTIFGQMTHGFQPVAPATTGLLKSLAATPTNSTATPEDGGPLTPITIESASISPQYYGPSPIDGAMHNYTDVVLVMSAIAPTPLPATITVTATDPHGNSAQGTFAANGVADTFNSSPFITPLVNQTVPAGKAVEQEYETIDLEHDLIYPVSPSLNVSSSSSSGTSSTQGTVYQDDATGVPEADRLIGYHLLAVQGNASYQAEANGPTGPYTGPLPVYVAATQYDMSTQGSGRAVDDYVTAIIGVGAKPIAAPPTVITGIPGTTLTNVVTARFRSADPAAQASSFVTTINWGDGSAPDTSTSINAPMVEVDPAQAGYSNFAVTGTHQYAQAGAYLADVTVTNALGLSQQIFGTAVIADPAAMPLTAAGQSMEVTGRQVTNRVLATLHDAGAPPSPAASYSAMIDWGDGSVTPGVVQPTAALGQFTVVGSHTYRDPETFSVCVRTRKTSTPAVPEAIAWSTIRLSGFQGPKHLPPFDQVHLVGILQPPQNAAGSSLPTKQTVGIPGVQSQTYLSYELTLINAGNLTSKPGNVKLYLSQQTSVNLTPTVNSSGDTIPAAIPLQIGEATATLPPLYEARFGALTPGQVISLFFYTGSHGLSQGDFRLRLPPNETGTGYNLLAQLNYDDPIANYEQIDRAAVAGPIQGIFVSQSAITTSEAGTSSSFTISLDKKPTANVTFTLTLGSTSTGNAVPGQFILPNLPGQTGTPLPIPATGTLTVTFTPADWNVPQTITVVGLGDSATTSGGAAAAIEANNTTYSISLGTPTTTDPYYSVLTGPSVTVTNLDRDGNVQVQPLTLTTTEGPGAALSQKFTIVLKRQPTSNVTLSMSISNPAEGTLTLPGQTTPSDSSQPILFTFTPDNYNQTQSFTVTGLNDGIPATTDYSINFAPIVSNDPWYNGILPQSVAVVNVNKNAEISVAPTTLTTTEASGSMNEATFTVTLFQAPTAEVDVQIVPSITTEGAIYLPGQTTPSDPTKPIVLKFLPSDASFAQTVTVQGLDDGKETNLAPYQITFDPVTSTDTNFNGLIPGPINITNIGRAGNVVVSQPTITTTTTPNATGAENQAQFMVSLRQAPTAPVTLTLTLGDTAHGNFVLADSSLSAAPLVLTFDPADGVTPQTVTVAGLLGSTVGDATYQITFAPAVSTDPQFSGATPTAVTVTDLDYRKNIVVTPTSLTTTAANGPEHQAQFTVALRQPPTAPVTVKLNVGNTAQGAILPPGDATPVASATLTFTPAGGTTPQTVSVVGIDDGLAGPDVSYSITFDAATSADDNFNEVTPSSVTVKNVNRESGITLSPSTLSTTASAGPKHTAKITVTLKQGPTGVVTLPIQIGNANAGEVILRGQTKPASSASPIALTFTPSGALMQTVELVGIAKGSVKGKVTYQIIFGPATSTDPAYSGLTPTAISVTDQP